MASVPIPVPLDNLIAFVRSLQPEGSPLDHLAAAMAVADGLQEQADALVGYFVDQARRAGASWTDIGTSMGMSKQAAQKRFVPKLDSDESLAQGRLFSRFTDRARNTVRAARDEARAAGTAAIGPDHLLVGLLAEPQGLAARAIGACGVGEADLRSALHLPANDPPADPDAPDRLPFSDAARSALEATLKVALHFGHNYIGTEHLLLGVLATDEQVSGRVAELGLTYAEAEQFLTAELARIVAARAAGAP